MPRDCCSERRRQVIWAWAFAIGFVPLAFCIASTSSCEPLYEDYDLGQHRQDGLRRISPRSYLMGTDRGGVPRIERVIVSPCVASATVATILVQKERYQTTSPLHRWTWRYALVFALHALVQQSNLAYILTCPEGSFPFVEAIAYTGFDLPYWGAQYILLYLALLKLRLCASSSVWWATRLYWAALFTVLLWLLTSEFYYLTYYKFVINILAVCITLGMACLLAFIVVSTRALFGAARDAVSAESETAMQVARVSAWLYVISVASSYISFLAQVAPLLGISWWFNETAYSADYCANAFCTLVISGIIGPQTDTEARLAEVGREVRMRRQRKIREKLVESTKAQTGPAVALAALMEGMDPDDLIREAAARFRCISWDLLRTRPDILLNASALDGAVAPAELYALSCHCSFSACDVFLSHSWHDDPQPKWDALEAWCEKFSRANGRAPTLWFDKVCINQEDIAQDLHCLAIFLAACNELLIICGETYITRLWCCVELFVYVSMNPEDQIRAPNVIVIGDTAEERQHIRDGWKSFDASSCACLHQTDKDRIMSVVDRCPGGYQGFNKRVRKVAAKVFAVNRNVTESEVQRWSGVLPGSMP